MAELATTPPTDTRRRKTSLTTFIVLMIGTLLFTLWMIRPYVLAVLMGVILARLFKPLDRFLIDKKIKPTWSALITTLAIIFVVIGPVSFFATRAVKQGIALGKVAAENPNFSLRSIVERLSEWGPVDALIEDPDALEAEIKQGLHSAVQSGSSLVLGWAAQIPEIILQLALACLMCYFVLVDGSKFRSWLQDKIPLEKDVQKKLNTSFQDTSRSVIWATLAAAAVQAALMMFGYFILGIPAAFLAGGLTFIFAWVPMIGSTPIWLAGAAYLYFQGFIGKAIIMIGIGLITGVADNFVRPMVLKGANAMHPMVSLIAIFGGIHLFGIFGVFVGPILAALLISILEIWPAVGKRNGLM